MTVTRQCTIEVATLASKTQFMSHQRNPRSLLTPAMHHVLDRMARATQLPLHALTPQQARPVYEVGSSMLEIAAHKVARAEGLGIPMRERPLLPARL